MSSEFGTKNLAIGFARSCIKIKVPFYLEEQFKKAACSVPQNLAEGSAKHTKKDRHKFYRIALGSFREVECLLDVLEITDEEINLMRKQLGGSLVKLCKAMN